MVDPQAVRRHNDPMDLVELARAVQNADKFVYATTSGKLQVIVDTIRSLQDQVRVQLCWQYYTLGYYVLYNYFTLNTLCAFILIAMLYSHTHTYHHPHPLTPHTHRPAVSWRHPRETTNSTMLPVTSTRSLARRTTCMRGEMAQPTSVCSPPRTGVAPLLTHSSARIVWSMTNPGPLQSNWMSDPET